MWVNNPIYQHCIKFGGQDRSECHSHTGFRWVNLKGDPIAPVGVHIFGGGSAFIITATIDGMPKATVNTTN